MIMRTKDLIDAVVPTYLSEILIRCGFFAVPESACVPGGLLFPFHGAANLLG